MIEFERDIEAKRRVVPDFGVVFAIRPCKNVSTGVPIIFREFSHDRY